MAAECAKAGSKIIADRHYDQTRFISGMKELGMVPHPRAKSKGSQLDERTTSSQGYIESMTGTGSYKVEGVFGWGKSIGGMRQTKLRGVEKVEMGFTLQVVARNVLTIARRTQCTRPSCA
jgi:hypothetical protein